VLNYSTHKITLQHKQTNQVKKNKKKNILVFLEEAVVIEMEIIFKFDFLISFEIKKKFVFRDRMFLIGSWSERQWLKSRLFRWQVSKLSIYIIPSS